MKITRFRFISLTSKAILAFGINPANLASMKSFKNDFTIKIEYIQEIKEFFETITDTEIIGEFYSKWEANNKLYLYLYASKPNAIENIDHNSSRIFSGTDMNKALKKKVQLEKLGYHTMLYRTPANAQTRLTERLLSFDLDILAFYTFHEITHRYIRQMGFVPYAWEEATCDLIGNYGALEFCKLRHPKLVDRIENNILIMEQIKTTINKYYNKIENNSSDNLKRIYSKCESRIGRLIDDQNLFYKTRYSYKVNNAFFLREKNYSENYFRLKQRYNEADEIKSFLAGVLQIKNIGRN